MGVVAFGRRQRTVHVNGTLVGVATWNAFRGTWTFSPRGEAAEAQYGEAMDGREFETRLELGEAVSLASKTQPADGPGKPGFDVRDGCASEPGEPPAVVGADR